MQKSYRTRYPHGLLFELEPIQIGRRLPNVKVFRLFSAVFAAFFGLLGFASAQQVSPTVPGPLSRYLVLFPSQITSGPYAGDLDILAQGFLADGSIEWSAEKPKTVCGQSYKEYAPVGVKDGSGGVYFVYSVESNDTASRGDRDLLMRHIDRNAVDLWGDSTNHVVVIAQSKYAEQNPRIIANPDGSMLVFYEVDYDTKDSLGDMDVAAVKVSADGKLVWPAGIWVANTKLREHLSGVVSDDRGGGIAFLEVSSQQPGTQATSDILAVHVDEFGSAAWGASKRPVVVAGSRYLEKNASVVGDGFGGAYVAYDVEYSTGPRAGDIDVFAQHLSSIGSREWVDSTAPPVISSNEEALERSPSVAPDSAGFVVGFRVLFHGDKRPSNMIGIQRMDHLGKLQWYEGRKPRLIGIDHTIPESPQMITDSAGNIFLLCEGRDTTTKLHQVYVQKFDRNGNLQWGDGESAMRAFATGDLERDPTAIPDGSGGLIVLAVREYLTGENAAASNIMAQRIGANGKFVWEGFRSPLMLTNSKQRDGKAVVFPSK